MGEKIKRTLATIITVTVVSAFAGYTVGALCSASSRDERLAAAEKRCKEICENCRKLAEENFALEDELAELRTELEKKEAAIDVLDDVIIRMRTRPEAEKLIKERLPAGMTNTIRYMDYRKITNITSAQYRLQQECTTDYQGIRRYGNYICVALGSAYGRDLGDTWKVTLKNGTSFKIILAEYKDNGSTDCFGHPDINYEKQDCINVIEFIVELSKVPESVRKAGTFTAMDWYGGLDGDGGNIVRMEYLGREWEP